jgi:hypothetical protein
MLRCSFTEPAIRALCSIKDQVKVSSADEVAGCRCSEITLRSTVKIRSLSRRCSMFSQKQPFAMGGKAETQTGRSPQE